MLRLLLTFALSLHLALAGGPGAPFCDEAGEDRGSPSACADQCIDCFCCAHRPVADLPLPAMRTFTLERQEPFEAAPARVIAPDPDEVQHVPKAARS